MNALNKYLLAVLLICFASMASAQTNGCYVSGTLRMYYQTPTPANPTTYFEGSAYHLNQDYCGTVSQYYTFASGPSGSNCWASYKGSGSKTNSSRYNIAGKKATFNLVVCPIDDYIVPLMLASGGFGCFYLRRLRLS
ncbi:MAG: hypothetical protein ACQUHE_14520 [Bacteroidia bacterium]